MIAIVSSSSVQWFWQHETFQSFCPHLTVNKRPAKVILKMASSMNFNESHKMASCGAPHSCHGVLPGDCDNGHHLFPQLLWGDGLALSLTASHVEGGAPGAGLRWGCSGVGTPLSQQGREGLRCGRVWQGYVWLTHSPTRLNGGTWFTAAVACSNAGQLDGWTHRGVRRHFGMLIQYVCRVCVGVEKQHNLSQMMLNKSKIKQTCSSQIIQN